MGGVPNIPKFSRLGILDFPRGEGGTLGEGKSNPTQPCPRSHLDTGTSYKVA